VLLSGQVRQPWRKRARPHCPNALGYDHPTQGASGQHLVKRDGPEPHTLDGDDDDADDMQTTPPANDAIIEKAKKLSNGGEPVEYTCPSFKVIYAKHPELVAMDSGACRLNVTEGQWATNPLKLHVCFPQSGPEKR